MQVNTRYINSTKGTASRKNAPSGLSTLHFRHTWQHRCVQAYKRTFFLTLNWTINQLKNCCEFLLLLLFYSNPINTACGASLLAVPLIPKWNLKHRKTLMRSGRNIPEDAQSLHPLKQCKNGFGFISACAHLHLVENLCVQLFLHTLKHTDISLLSSTFRQLYHDFRAFTDVNHLQKKNY